MKRHKNTNWETVASRLVSQPMKLWSLNEMEQSGGEPDVIGIDEATGALMYCDCSPESPTGRRSLCYDREAWESRKENKPEGNAIERAAEMGIEMLTEEQYWQLQQVGPFDQKTSSWLTTPQNIRKLGGAIFGDFRYWTVFTYHNGVQSYYAARGFRGLLFI